MWISRVPDHVLLAQARAAGTPLGATGVAQPRDGVETPHNGVEIVVFGAHMAGQKLNPGVLALGGWFVRACRTAPVYRMLALPGRLPRPALVPAADGASLTGEV